eukprot:5409440-Prymnesium_polylepis.1
MPIRSSSCSSVGSVFEFSSATIWMQVTLGRKCGAVPIHSRSSAPASSALLGWPGAARTSAAAANKAAVSGRARAIFPMQEAFLIEEVRPDQEARLKT